MAGGSPTSTLPLGASLGVFKLFEEVDIGFVEQHSYERQEMEEAVEAAAAGSGAAAAASEPA